MISNKITLFIFLCMNIALLGVEPDDGKPTAEDMQKCEAWLEAMHKEERINAAAENKDPKMFFRSTQKDQPRLTFRPVNGVLNAPPPQPSQEQAWMMQSSIRNAPPLLRGICNYLKKNAGTRSVSSSHRFILVGAPGTGKTTLARAVAWHLGYPIHFIQAASLLGQFRNETSVNIRNCFNKFMHDRRPVVIVIDELHKLFEHHTDGKTDHSENAATFWQILDEFEKLAPHVIIIGTSNTVDKLPPELKSRFNGKIITMELPSRGRQLKLFNDMIAHDDTIRLDAAVDTAYIQAMLDQLNETSLRDVQLLIDTAKMFTYVHDDVSVANGRVVLKREHFEQAMKQLKKESAVLKRGILETISPKIKNIGMLLAIAVNGGVLANMTLGSMNGLYAYVMHTPLVKKQEKTC